jgi:Cu2+-containing amine oxidase
VTKYHWNELLGNDLPTYVNGEGIANADFVVWYTGGVHHQYRDEDGDFVNGHWVGSAIVMWTSFMMKPMNLFSTTPLYP